MGNWQSYYVQFPGNQTKDILQIQVELKPPSTWSGRIFFPRFIVGEWPSESAEAMMLSYLPLLRLAGQI